jgi:hypothetical protein
VAGTRDWRGDVGSGGRLLRANAGFSPGSSSSADGLAVTPARGKEVQASFFIPCTYVLDMTKLAQLLLHNAYF